VRSGLAGGFQLSDKVIGQDAITTAIVLTGSGPQQGIVDKLVTGAALGIYPFCLSLEISDCECVKQLLPCGGRSEITRATPYFSRIRKLTTSKAGAAHRTRHLFLCFK
jgi:hypothetical protein